MSTSIYIIAGGHIVPFLLLSFVLTNHFYLTTPFQRCGGGDLFSGTIQGRIQVWADSAPAPLLTTKSCKFSLFWGHISQFSLNFDTRPPLFANPASGPAIFWSQSGMESDGGGENSRRGWNQMRGDLAKLSAEAKNAPPTAKLQQILVF